MFLGPTIEETAKFFTPFFGEEVTREQIADIGWQCLQDEWTFNDRAGMTNADDSMAECMSTEGIGPEHSMKFDVPEEIVRMAPDLIMLEIGPSAVDNAARMQARLHIPVVLDDGRMTDGQGRTVDFKNTVIVMTSNLGSQMIQQMSGDDYQLIKVAVMGEVKAQFRPEFVNRIDEIVVFHPLDEKHIKSIAKLQIGNLEKRLAKMEIALDVTDAALAQIAASGFDPVYGARPLKRAIQSEIENPLAKAILEGRFAPKDTIHVDARGGRMVFEKTPARAAA